MLLLIIDGAFVDADEWCSFQWGVKGRGGLPKSRVFYFPDFRLASGVDDFRNMTFLLFRGAEGGIQICVLKMSLSAEIFSCSAEIFQSLDPL